MIILSGIGQIIITIIITYLFMLFKQRKIRKERNLYIDLAEYRKEVGIRMGRKITKYKECFSRALNKAKDYKNTING